jgi:hypothetical protein
MLLPEALEPGTHGPPRQAGAHPRGLPLVQGAAGHPLCAERGAVLGAPTSLRRDDLGTHEGTVSAGSRERRSP